MILLLFYKTTIDVGFDVSLSNLFYMEGGGGSINLLTVDSLYTKISTVPHETKLRRPEKKGKLQGQS